MLRTFLNILISVILFIAFPTCFAQHPPDLIKSIISEQTKTESCAIQRFSIPLDQKRPIPELLEAAKKQFQIISSDGEVSTWDENSNSFPLKQLSIHFDTEAILADPTELPFLIKIHQSSEQKHSFFINIISGNLPQKTFAVETQIGKPKFYTLPKDSTSLFNGEKEISFSYINLKNAKLRLKLIPEADELKLTNIFYSRDNVSRNDPKFEPTPISFDSIKSTISSEILLPLEDSKNRILTHQVNFTQLLKNKIKPGPYLLEVTGESTLASEKAQKISYQWILRLSDLGVITKIAQNNWLLGVIDLWNGQPIPEATVSVYKKDGKLLFTKSASEGCCLLPNFENAAHFIKIQTQNDHILLTRNDLTNTKNITKKDTVYLPELRCYLITDRNIYTPNEIIRLKIFLREITRNALSIPEGTEKLRLRIQCPANPSKSINLTIPASSPGVFDFSWKVPLEFNGPLELSILPFESETILAKKYVQITEISEKAFDAQLALSIPKSKEMPSNLSVKFHAFYPNRIPVFPGFGEFHAHIFESNFFPNNFPNYLFGSHLDFDPQWLQTYYPWNSKSKIKLPSKSLSKNFTLDAQGSALWEIPLPQQKHPIPFFIETSATLHTPALHLLEKTQTAAIHPSTYYVGVKNDFIYKNKDGQFELELIAIDYQEKPLKIPLKATVQISRNNFTDNSLAETYPSFPVLIAPNSDKNPTLVSIPTPKPGIYVVSITGTDPYGAAFETRIQKFISKAQQDLWGFSEKTHLILLSEQPSYSTGETAQLRIISPLQGFALITVEKDNILDYHWRFLSKENQSFSIPISKNDAPGITVSLTMIEGAKSSLHPKMKTTSCSIQVKPSDCELKINFLNKADVDYATDHITLTGEIKTKTGTPVENANILLYLVHDTLFQKGLMSYPNPLDYFYEPQKNIIQTYLPLSYTNKLKANNIKSSKVWQHSHKCSFNQLSPTFPLSRDIIPCPVWIPNLTTNANGIFSADLLLPSCIGKYHIICIADSKDASFGCATQTITHTYPLKIVSEEEKFIHVGDKIPVSAEVTNNTDKIQFCEVFLTLKTVIPNTIKRPPTKRTLAVLELQPYETKTLASLFSPDSTGQVLLEWTVRPAPNPAHPTTTKNLKNSFYASTSSLIISAPCPLLSESYFFSTKTHPKKFPLTSLIPENILHQNNELQLTLSTTPSCALSNVFKILQFTPYKNLRTACYKLNLHSTNNKSLYEINPYFFLIKDFTAVKTEQALSLILSLQLKDGSFADYQGSTTTSNFSIEAIQYLGRAKSLDIKIPQTAIDSAVNYLNSIKQKTIDIDLYLALALFNKLTQADITLILSELKKPSSPKTASFYFKSKAILVLQQLPKSTELREIIRQIKYELYTLPKSLIFAESAIHPEFDYWRLLACHSKKFDDWESQVWARLCQDFRFPPSTFKESLASLSLMLLTQFQQQANLNLNETKTPFLTIRKGNVPYVFSANQLILSPYDFSFNPEDIHSFQVSFPETPIFGKLTYTKLPQNLSFSGKTPKNFPKIAVKFFHLNDKNIWLETTHFKTNELALIEITLTPPKKSLLLENLLIEVPLPAGFQAIDYSILPPPNSLYLTAPKDSTLAWEKTLHFPEKSNASHFFLFENIEYSRHQVGFFLKRKLSMSKPLKFHFLARIQHPGKVWAAPPTLRAQSHPKLLSMGKNEQLTIENPQEN